jgi:hypothetical protein
MKTPLSMLDEVRVASPCPVRWNELTGDDRTRACEMCGKHVHNLSAMTRSDAERALSDPAVECVTFLRAAGGRVVTADPPRGRWRRIGGLVLAWVVLALVAGCGDDKPRKTTPNGTPIPEGCEYDPATGNIRSLGKR